jgi:carbamoyl-phosphate synthase small subunit
MNAILALENGQWFDGISVGAAGLSAGEVVFNTSLTGYQEVLTDPTASAPKTSSHAESRWPGS